MRSVCWPPCSYPWPRTLGDPIPFQPQWHPFCPQMVDPMMDFHWMARAPLLQQGAPDVGQVRAAAGQCTRASPLGQVPRPMPGALCCAALVCSGQGGPAGRARHAFPGPEVLCALCCAASCPADGPGGPEHRDQDALDAPPQHPHQPHGVLAPAHAARSAAQQCTLAASGGDPREAATARDRRAGTATTQWCTPPPAIRLLRSSPVHSTQARPQCLDPIPGCPCFIPPAGGGGGR